MNILYAIKHPNGIARLYKILLMFCAKQTIMRLLPVIPDFIALQTYIVEQFAEFPVCIGQE